MRTTTLATFLIAALSAAAQTSTGWTLVWSDEFNAPAASPPDPSNWNYDLGGGGWGNGEAETYTNSAANAFHDGHGNLVIRAVRDASGNYTSARLQTGSPGASTHTADGNWKYGRIQARMKLPFGKGVWPAFWLLGENIGTVPWPGCGEVDIMENFGAYVDGAGVSHNNVSTTSGTAHGPGYSGAGGIGKSYTLPFGEKVADDFHVYSIEWTENSIEWFVDGASYHKITPASLPAGKQWVFNNPFFILINLAIGGPNTFLGRPDPNAAFAAQDLVIDYVRVYQAAPVSSVTPVITPGRVLNVASYLGAVAPGSLAVVYGSNLAGEALSVPLADSGSLPVEYAGVKVTVNDIKAPLLYVSPGQINFQMPWATPVGATVDVKVTRDGVASNAEAVTIDAASSPSLFLSEYVNGVAWMTGPGPVYQLWANGLGPKNAPQQDGTPAVYTGSLTPLEVPSCQLIVGGQEARIDYCGAAPGEIIDQVNFVYPPGVTASAAYVDASLTVNGTTGRFRLPVPTP